MKKRKTITAEEHRQRVQDFCEKLMDAFLEKMRLGQTEKWVKPWGNKFSGLSELPYNPKTLHRYSGQNLMFLIVDMISKGLEDPRYLTLGQAKIYAKENGMDPNEVKIIKGSKAAMILQPVPIRVKGKKDKNSKVKDAIEAVESGNKDEDNNTDDQNEERKIVKFKTSPRFNGSQFTGIPEFKIDKSQKRSCSAIVDHLIKTNKIDIITSPRAAFSHKSDKIFMPDQRDFTEPEHHTSTLLHELYHWTGSQKREKRISDNYKEFHDNYAKEEIRAQFFMLAASAFLGIPVETEQEIDYIEHFSGKDGLDYRGVYKEFAQASKMFNDMLVRFALNEQPTPEWFPAKETWPERSEEAIAEAIVAEAVLLSEDSEPEANTTEEQNNEEATETKPGSEAIRSTEAKPDSEAVRSTEATHDSETVEEVKWHHYGVKHPRGIGLGASPPNHVDYQESEKYPGGVVTYSGPLSDKNISHYFYDSLGTTAPGSPYVVTPVETAPASTESVFDLLEEEKPVTNVFDLIDEIESSQSGDIGVSTEPQANHPFDLIQDNDSQRLSDSEDRGPRR